MEKLRADDYVSITKKYLKEYYLYIQYLNNTKAALADINRQLNTESIKTSRFGERPGYTRGKASSVELAANKRIELENRREVLHNEMLSAERIVSCISGSLPKLDAEKQTLIKGFYFDHLSYKELARQHSYCEKWCRNLIRQAEREMAVMIFGVRASSNIDFSDMVV